MKNSDEPKSSTIRFVADHPDAREFVTIRRCSGGPFADRSSYSDKQITEIISAMERNAARRSAVGGPPQHPIASTRVR